MDARVVDAGGARPRDGRPRRLGRRRRRGLGRSAMPATVMPLVSCGDCAACASGASHICYRLIFLGIDAPGSMQSRWNVPASVLVRLPDDLSLQTAALAEPTAVAVHDVRRAGLAAGRARRRRRSRPDRAADRDRRALGRSRGRGLRAERGPAGDRRCGRPRGGRSGGSRTPRRGSTTGRRAPARTSRSRSPARRPGWATAIGCLGARGRAVVVGIHAVAAARRSLPRVLARAHADRRTGV